MTATQTKRWCNPMEFNAKLARCREGMREYQTSPSAVQSQQLTSWRSSWGQWHRGPFALATRCTEDLADWNGFQDWYRTRALFEIQGHDISEGWGQADPCRAARSKAVVNRVLKQSCRGQPVILHFLSRCQRGTIRTRIHSLSKHDLRQGYRRHQRVRNAVRHALRQAS